MALALLLTVELLTTALLTHSEQFKVALPLEKLNVKLRSATFVKVLFAGGPTFKSALIVAAKLALARKIARSSTKDRCENSCLDATVTTPKQNRMHGIGTKANF